MVFSSVPVYSDHPSWHQVQQANRNENSQLQPPSPPQLGGGSGGVSIRPGSIVDRARQAKVPQPEAGLNCPRCDSANTKFCYFNNYSLTQPRHFCKACRRYWTRGGSLRNVPVGGGYRKNKRSQNSTTSAKSQATGSKSTSVSPSPSSCSHFPQPSPQFSFMATLQSLGQYGARNIGPNITGFQSQMTAPGAVGEADLGFRMGSNSGGSSNLLVGGVEQWRFPFLGSLDQLPTNFYPNQTPAKMEESQGLNFLRHIFGVPENNQCLSGNQWADFSGANSSSTSQLL